MTEKCKNDERAPEIVCAIGLCIEENLIAVLIFIPGM
jgi:hypothetical protein